ncbi:MAG: type II toxin-antitoxin system RelE/ParE family toxin [Coriobacteriales bacterium]|jgi:toxin ParE1/3/4|nr:type II toxin-antitoxin system RelE/ParE family toxin [Coriobacteriales bacterium]
MARYEIVISDAADQNIRDIIHHIAISLHSPVAAASMLDVIDAQISSLDASPQRNPLVRDERLALLGYRWAKAKSYMIFYTIDEAAKTVLITRVLYGRRHWIKLV